MQPLASRTPRPSSQRRDTKRNSATTSAKKMITNTQTLVMPTILASFAAATRVSGGGLYSRAAGNGRKPPGLLALGAPASSSSWCRGFRLVRASAP